MIFQLNNLSEDDVKKALRNAIESPKGFGYLKIEVEPDVFDYFAVHSNSDIRKALNALDMAVRTSSRKEGKVFVTVEDAKECI